MLTLSQVLRGDLEVHSGFACPQPCQNEALGCEVRVTRDQLAAHQSDECAKREVRCPHAGCQVMRSR
jgi:hypothetical protein